MKAKYIIPIFLGGVLLVIYIFFNKEKVVYEKPELIFNERVSRKAELMDINSVDLEGLMRQSVSLKLAKEIISYREFTGKIENLEELVRINGIGEKTVEKYKNKFFVDSNCSKEKILLRINTANEQEMLWYGFSRKDIKKIVEYRRKENKIYSNVELIGIIGTKMYDDLGRYISFL